MRHGFLIAFAASLFIVTAAHRAATQTLQAEPKAGQSTVRGVVTYADTGRPLRNANIVLLSNDGGMHQWIATTNRRGEFAMESVAAGRYILFVDAPGILKPQGFQRNKNALIAQIRLHDKRDLFTEVIVNGTDGVNVNAQAVRGGVITGRVVTEDDQPVAHADIKLLKNENGKWLPVAFTWVDGDRKGLKTDAGGEYRIVGLTAGDYAVRVSEPIVPTGRKPVDDDAYTDGSLMVTFYPSAHTIDDAQAVTVVEGSEATGIDIRLPERTPHTLSGKVIGPENQPGAFVQVWIERVDEMGLVDETYGGILADHDGSWRVQGIPAGEYVVTLGGAMRIETPEGSTSATVAPKRINVRVADEDVVIPETRLSWGARVQGKLTLDGKPPERPYQILPRLIPTENDVTRRRDKSRPTLTRGRFASGGDHVREKGQFFMLSVPVGKYWFDVTTHTTLDFYVKSVTRKGVDLMQTPLKVNDEALIDDVVIALATDFATIDGEITRRDATEKQLLRDTVVVLAPATDATRRVARTVVTSQADAEGKFTFTSPPGEYFIAAFTPAQLKKLTTPIDEHYFKKDNQKFTRVKVRAAEKLKGVTVSLAEN